MVNKRFITQSEVYTAAWVDLQKNGWPRGCHKIWGVPRGGVSAALAFKAAAFSASEVDLRIVSTPEEADVIVDDIWGTGRTEARYKERFPEKPFRVLFDKRAPVWRDQWLVMPWEVGEDKHDQSAEDSVIRLLEHIGETPDRPGLKETPRRVIEAWAEWASGYHADQADLLKCFEDGAEGADEMIFQGNIPFFSTCEHHLAPFFGVVHIGYIPDGKIVGLSKFGRLVEFYARRLQVQERLGTQLASTLTKELHTKGVGVVIRARHLCMESRGVQKIGTITYTSSLTGSIKQAPEARAEFLKFVQLADARSSNL